MTTRWPTVRSLIGLCLLLPVAAQSEQFSIVVIPDTQMYAEAHPEVFEAQIDWIVANEVAENIIYVAHLGDIKDSQGCDTITVNVGTGLGRSEWQIVDQAFDDLDTAGIAYGVIPGNHDFDQVSGDCPNYTTERPLGTYNTLFGPARYGGMPEYGGNRVMDSNEDNFILFESNEVKFIAINLAYKEAPDLVDAEIPWADALLKAYPNRLGIVTSHYFLDENPGNSFGPYGQEVYDGIASNPNLIMMLSAHRWGEAWREENTGRSGMGTVHALLSDYQRDEFPFADGDPMTPFNDPNPAGINFINLSQESFGDSGFMRIMRFDTVFGTVEIETFIPPVIPIKNRIATYGPLMMGNTIVSTYTPGSGAGMTETTASNLSFTFHGYTTTFDIFECDGHMGGICTAPIGTITFPSNSGMQTDGTNFTVTYGVYDENDIQNVDWTVDVGTGEITAFSLTMDSDPGCFLGITPLPCNQTTARFDFFSTGLMETRPSGGGCIDDGMGGRQCISAIAIGFANLFVPQ